MTKARKFFLGGIIFGFLGLLYFAAIIASGKASTTRSNEYTDLRTGSIAYYSGRPFNYEEKIYTDGHYETRLNYAPTGGYKVSCYYRSDLFRALDGHSSATYNINAGYQGSNPESECISEARSEWFKKVIFAVLFPSMLIIIGCGLGFLLSGKKPENQLPPIPPFSGY